MKQGANLDGFHLFIDTNTLLHFQRFDEVDWPRVCGVARVILLIEATVIRELDRFKNDNSNIGRRDRARSVLARLVPLLEESLDGTPAEVRKGTTVQPVLELPIFELSELDLDYQVADDRILAAVVSFGKINPNIPVALMTDDGAARLKARLLNIRTMSPEDTLDRVDILDERDKSIRRLRSELAEIKARRPVLEIELATWDQAGRLVQVENSVPVEDADAFADIETELEREQQSLISEIEPYLDWDPGYYDDYLKEIDGYIWFLRHHLRTIWISRSAQRARVGIRVVNRGTASARKVEVTLTGGDVVHIVDPQDSPFWYQNTSRIVPPNRPVAPPAPGLDYLYPSEEYEDSQSTILDIAAGRPIELLLGDLRSSVGSEPEAWSNDKMIELRVPHLNAQQEWTSEEFVIFYYSPHKRARELTYTIHAEELETTITGTVVVRFQFDGDDFDRPPDER